MENVWTNLNSFDSMSLTNDGRVAISNAESRVHGSRCSLARLVHTYTSFITKLTEKEGGEEESFSNKIEDTHTRERGESIDSFSKRRLLMSIGDGGQQLGFLDDQRFALKVVQVLNLIVVVVVIVVKRVRSFAFQWLFHSIDFS